jgi:pyruvate,water dikinase
VPTLIARQSQQWVLDIVDATDPAVCGGKAAGLARLQRIGCAVPAAMCLTTHFYRHWLRLSGLEPRMEELVEAARDPAARPGILETIRREIEAAPLPEDLLAALRDGADRLGAGPDDLLMARSSGVREDGGHVSHAGIHASVAVAAHDPDALVSAVKVCWASLWTESAWTYRERLAVPQRAAAMAVVVQRFVAAACSGVAFSADPLTNDPTTVVIAACWGTAGALVGGTMTPDEYYVSAIDAVPPAISRRPGRQTTKIVWRGGREATVPLDDTQRDRPVLTDSQVCELVRLVKVAERATGRPVDVEWVSDGTTFWAVQARPITTLTARARRPYGGATLWTRANLKEVFPELPSPLALSYLTMSLNRMFRTYHAAFGYSASDRAELVKVIRGRPYLNLSLMQAQTIEGGGDPAIVGRMFGGADPSHQWEPAPASASRLSFSARARLAREMLATFFRTPSRGRRLFRAMRREAAELATVPLEALDTRGLLAHLERLGSTLVHDTTLRRLHEVVSAQSRAYMVLEALLAAWIPADADTLMKRVMTGLGTLPNVRMVHRLMDLAVIAAADDRARAYFTAELDEAALRGYESALDGTAVLGDLRAFLREFGHRGPYESDVMSARFAEDPAPVLRLIQLHVRAGATVMAARHADELRRVRLAAIAEVRRALRQGRGRLAFAAQWAVFSLACSTLQRLVALRDECRHVTTMMVAHLRRVALEIGRRASRAGILADPTDVFFLTWDEMPRILAEPDRGWRALAAGRQRQRDDDARVEAPNVVTDDGNAAAADTAPRDGDELLGYGVSPGVVTGHVRVLKSIDGIGHLSGEIAVFPSIEPTLTPIFPLVKGIIAEMGGLLSHASILAREYGLPAVVSVRDATRRLKDGDRVELDGATGRVRVLERAADPHDSRSEGTVGGRLEDERARERSAAAVEVGGERHAERGAGHDVGDVVALEVDAAQRDGGGERVERPAQPGIVRGEDAGDGEHRRRVARWKGVDVRKEGGTGEPGGQNGVRPRPADQVLDRELHEAGGGEGERGQRRGVVQA